MCLTIAGSDSGGGAGIQADLKTMEAMGTFGTSAITAVTAQNTRGVASSHVLPTEEIAHQINAVADDFSVAAVKTGMLAMADVIETVRAAIEAMTAPLVVDPVMVAATGDRLVDEAAESAYQPLIGDATVVTPNADEARVLTGLAIEDEDDQVAAGESILEMGADAALIKGGHLDGDPVCDVLVERETVTTFEHPRVESTATHGSGCTLASAIAASLAQGTSIDEAVAAGLGLMERAVRYPLDVGHGPGSVHHLAALRNNAAKASVIDAVGRTVATLVDRDIRPLIPEVGTNVVGATPFAETQSDTIAVEGRLHRTSHGVGRSGGVAVGASSHVARFLLALREHDPTIRFAINVRNEEAVQTAIDALDWSTARYDRRDQPAAVRDAEGSTMRWAAETVMAERDAAPVAVYDPGAHGKEPITKLLAHDPEELTERALAVCEQLIR